MKKNNLKNAAFAASLAFVFFFTSCQKLIDYVNKPGNSKKVSDLCQVQKISVDAKYGPNAYDFNYNKRNELESLIVTPQQDGYTNMFFVYDNKRRVSQILHSGLPNANPENVWRTDKFAYNKSDQIITDSLIIPFFHFVIVSHSQYDAYSRIIATVDSVWSNGSIEGMYYYFFTYDERGNLATQVRRYSWTFYSDTLTFAQYDDKINIRQTNKIWMYIDRNYSINNCLSGATYSNYGLPVNFAFEQYSLGYGRFLDSPVGTATVEYQCDGKGNHQ